MPGNPVETVMSLRYGLATALRFGGFSMKGLALGMADEADRDQVLELGRPVHREGMFLEVPFSESKFNRIFDRVIGKPDRHLGLKVSLGGRILGFGHCALGEYFVGEGGRIATVNSICVDRDVRSGLLGGRVAVRLVRGIEAWARMRDAQAILYHVTSGRGVARADRFFRGMGMTTLGGNYGIRLA